MRKILFGGIFSLVALAFVVVPSFAAKTSCTTIQSGQLLASNGDVISTGYDKWGYNYQAHMFNGYYDNFSRPSVVATSGDKLIMKWNDAWLSNQSCDNDNLLDRHLGFPSYKGSGAWLTNHQMGTYDDGTKWEDFVKIVAVPLDAELKNETWYSVDGIEIGPSIWGDFAIVQEVYTDPTAEAHGLYTLSKFGPGFGLYK